MRRRWRSRSVLFLALLLSAGVAARPAEPPEAARWVRQLGDDNFDRREAAGRALKRLGEAAGPALRQAADTSSDPEVRRRAAQLIEAIRQRLAADARVLRGHTVNISSVAFSPDGKHLLSGGRDGIVRIWDAGTGREMRSLRAGGVVTGAAYSGDGSRVLAANDEVLILWQASTGKELRRIHRPEEANWYFQRAALAPGGWRALTGQQDGTLRLWDLQTGKQVYCIKAHSGGHTEAVVFSPSGEQALTCGWDGTAALWDARTGNHRCRYTGGHTHNILSAVAFSPDGKRAATASANDKVTCGELALWDVATGNLLRAWQGHDKQINAAAFSPDGRRLLTASHDTTTRLWDVSSGRELACFHGHTKPVETVAWSPEGRWAASAGQDCTIRLWRILAE